MCTSSSGDGSPRCTMSPLLMLYVSSMVALSPRRCVYLYIYIYIYYIYIYVYTHTHTHTYPVWWLCHPGGVCLSACGDEGVCVCWRVLLMKYACVYVSRMFVCGEEGGCRCVRAEERVWWLCHPRGVCSCGFGCGCMYMCLCG